jgi:hypothetical protein
MILPMPHKLLMSVLVVLHVGASACASGLHIRHRDHTADAVQLILDGRPVGQTRFGDDLFLSLEEGEHHLEARRTKDQKDPWSAQGDGWRFYFQDSGDLVLLPPTVITPEARAADD